MYIHAQDLFQTIVYIVQGTDICQHALDAIAESKIQRVQIVGRRGPLQVAFTIKELREMTKLLGCRPVLDPHDFDAVRDLLKGTQRHLRWFTSILVVCPSPSCFLFEPPDNSLDRVCIAHHPGSRGVAGILSITMPPFSIKTLQLLLSNLVPSPSHPSVGKCWGEKSWIQG